MLLKQTKIVATISDQRCDVDFIKQLFDAGMNVVRMNTAHLGREGAEKLINNVRSVSNRIRRSARRFWLSPFLSRRATA